MIERLIEFDTREMNVPYVNKYAHVHANHEALFRIRKDIIRPLSTDRYIWYRVFEDDSETDHPKDENIKTRWSPWELEDLQNHLKNAPKAWPPHWIVAFTIHEHPGGHFEDYPPISDEQRNQWQFLGFDISEDVLLSGLMSMGYTEEDHQEVDHFASKLNEYHLFVELEDALQFCEWRNTRSTRDQGHGPFYVFGIYVVSKHE